MFLKTQKESFIDKFRSLNYYELVKLILEKNTQNDPKKVIFFFFFSNHFFGKRSLVVRFTSCETITVNLSEFQRILEEKTVFFVFYFDMNLKNQELYYFDSRKC